MHPLSIHVYTTKWGAYPEVFLGQIVPLPFFRQPRPCYKRIHKGLAHKFCLQNLTKLSGKQVLLTKRSSTHALLRKRSGNQDLVTIV